MDRALLFLVTAIADLFMIVLLMRLYLQLFRANFRNPIAQAILRISAPVVTPLRRIVAPIGMLDTATLVAALVFQVLFVLLIGFIYKLVPNLLELLLYGALRVVLVSLRLFLFSIFIYVILSWVGGGRHNPFGELLGSISEPMLAPARRIIPPIGGLDLSPIAVLLLLQATIIVISSLLPPWLI